MLSKQQRGFTLIELMISMVIGLFLLAGVFTIYLSSMKTRDVVKNEVKMMSDAQFALETISFDLRHAGSYGHHNFEDKINVRDEEKFIAGTGTAVTGQCGGAATSWAVDVDRPVYARDDGTDYLTSCMNNWLRGDSLELRYAAPLPIGTLESNLSPNTIYLKSIPDFAHMFVGSTPPDAWLFKKDNGNDKPNIRYFLWQSRGYYIANFTDKPGDGIPSLRMVSLQPGPVVSDNTLLRGVEDLQVQFGLDIPGAGATAGTNSASMYVNPDVVGVRWNQVVSVRLWLVVRSEREFEEVDPASTYSVAGVVRVNGDKFKRLVVTSTIRLRNANI